jgi:N-acyl-D-amino-acid deacylase
MAELDLVIRGAVVYDGTGAPGREQDIGIKGDRIAQVAKGLSGAAFLDARGLAAAPGFIDTHSHSDLKVLEAPALEPKLRQGVTLELFGQDGISIAPVRAEDVDRRRRQLSGLLTNPAVSWQWRSVADYLAEVEKARPAVDVAYLVPHGAVRESVLGLQDRGATSEELQRMRALLFTGLEQGAFGLSTGLIYPPCCYADTAELVSLCEVAAAKKTPIVVHMRSESDRLLEAMDEMFQVGQRAKVHVHISHFKIAGRNNWPKAARAIEAIDRAAASGVRVTADQYPYIAGSTMLGAILPPWVHSGGTDEAVQRLASPELRAKMRAEILDPKDAVWDNFWKWSGPEGIVVSDIPSGKRGWLVGKTLRAAGDAEKRDALDLALDLLYDEKMGVAMVSFSQAEEVIEKFLSLPFVNVCTDGLMGGRPHPRAYGTYPRILGKYVRDGKVLPLAQAVRKMSGLAADTFGFHDHGYLREGKRANIVMFDPETVTDTATFDQPLQFPTGVPHVIVGGRLVLRDGQLTGQRPGTVVRRAPAA